MLTSQLAVAHARALDSAILLGAGSTSISAGLVGLNGTDGASGFLAANSSLDAKDASTTGDVVSAGDLLLIRREMGRYGVDPTRVAFVLPYDQYYELMDDAGFSDITEVGSDAALGRGINPRVTGVLGFIYGSPVVASEFLANQIDTASGSGITTTAAVAVNLDQFVIPRLRGVNIETDYQVAYQRTALVASQSLGFEQLAANSTDNNVAVRITYQ